MGRVKIPYYVVIKGRGYWRPTAAMRRLGFAIVRCGADGPAAWAIAQSWAERWSAVRTGRAPPPSAPPENSRDPEAIESTIAYPAGSFGAAFARYRRTPEWARKAPRTREDWWRGWKRIRPLFGDLAPATVGLELVSGWRQRIEAGHGLREAHRALKIWRALWKVAAAMQLCVRDADPSLGVRNTAAAGRQATWSEGEVVRLVKGAWRSGHAGLAAAMAVMWESQFSPVDVRSLTAARLGRTGDGRSVAFADRAKTGTAVAAPLSRRTSALLAAYLAGRGVELLPTSPVFVTRGAPTSSPKGGRPWAPRPYTKDTFAEEFRAVRTLVFGAHEHRQLADFRRSGAVEAIEGGASAEQLGLAMGNTLGASNALFKTYVPVDMATVETVQTARRDGRKRLRKAAESVDTFAPKRPV